MNLFGYFRNIVCVGMLMSDGIVIVWWNNIKIVL